MYFRRFSATLYTLGGAAAGREKTDYDDEYQEECGHGAAGAVHAAVGDAQAERAVCAGAVHDPAGGVHDHRGHHDVPAQAEKEAGGHADRGVWPVLHRGGHYGDTQCHGQDLLKK